MKLNLADKFWTKVAVSDIEDCWEWQAGGNSKGYGTYYFNSKVSMAHRVAAFLAGLVPTVAAPTNKKVSGFVLHKCDNRRCCNPRHFFIGTYTDNQNDMVAKGRQKLHKGSSNSEAKFTDTEIAHIRTAHASGAKQKDLAKLYKVHPTTIHYVVRNRTYTK